ncbi:pilus assembly protein [Nocardioides sp. GY 10113]|uniref:TadE family protein n=1 Tax=Nocardioides sp. GY 10113 TaxID=2569761 RepID=UPI0010A7EE42|nr:TadE family protein [Nocardioides sp. GY 10113]TIC88142.1 pilus assembly protein [Nocardioides sp. GY 10113]
MLRSYGAAVRFRRGSGASRRRGRGAAAVEFALVLPILLYLVFGVIDFGVALSFRQSVSQAAAEGARAAAVQVDPSLRQDDSVAAIESALSGTGKSCSSAGMTCGFEAAPASCPACVKVSVSYDYKEYPLIPSVPGFGILFDTFSHSVMIRTS